MLLQSCPSCFSHQRPLLHPSSYHLASVPRHWGSGSFGPAHPPYVNQLESPVLVPGTGGPGLIPPSKTGQPVWARSHYCACVVLSLSSRVRLCATPWPVACQAPLSVGLSRQEHWSGLPRPTPRDLPNPGIEPMSLMSATLAGGFFTTEWDLVHYMDFEANHDYKMCWTAKPKIL